MWDQLSNIASILFGQSILSCLDLKSIVKLEAALVTNERRQTLSSFLSYYSQGNVEVNIPRELSKLKWLQAHDFSITKSIVHLDKLNATFETKLINRIQLVDNNTFISSTTVTYIPNDCYEKIFSVRFDYQQNSDIIVELFSRFHHLRELKVQNIPDGWMQIVLRGLHNISNYNILIEKLNITLLMLQESSLAEIAKYCPRLQSLSVNFDIEEDSLLALSTHCPLLNQLNISYIPRIFKKKNAVLCAPALSCIHKIQTPYSRYLDGNISNYRLTIPYLTELRELSMDGYYDTYFVPLISQYCLKLEIINISEECSATSTQLLQLVQNCINLHTIHFSNDVLYHEEFLIGLAERCPNLQKLYFSHFIKHSTIPITDSSLLALSNNCLYLQALDLKGYVVFTESVVLQLIYSCKHLQRLYLPHNCMSEDTVLRLPVIVARDFPFLTLYFSGTPWVYNRK